MSSSTKRPKSSRKTRAATEPPFAYTPPLTTSDASFLVNGRDDILRETLYSMVLSLGRLQTCREAFGRAIGLTGSQFAVLMGTAYTQGRSGVSIGLLAAHVHLASTHVTTEVGRLYRLGLLTKVPSADDGRSVLVSLSKKGELAVQSVTPLVRAVNDRLFADVGADELQAVHSFFIRFLLNSELALADVRERRHIDEAKVPQ